MCTPSQCLPRGACGWLAAGGLLWLLGTPIEAGAVDVCAAPNPVASIAVTTPTSAFTDNGDGTVTHALTGLMWKKCAQGLSGAQCTTGAGTTMSWQAALAAAVADTTGGHADWRLPNIKELGSIVELCGHLPSINQTLFPNTPLDRFHSSTSYPTGASVEFVVLSTDGNVTTSFKGTAASVRLVRGGRPIDSFDAQNAPPPPALLDVDASSSATKYDALTDGLILVRYMSGLVGSAMIDGALGGTASRVDPVAIKAYLDAIGAMLDVDGNGSTEVLNDGLLIIRYLFGLRGDALITGAIGPGATRVTPTEIEDFIRLLMP
jgi:uncharacterized protein DUF1566